jgi:two-component system sensor histidine kinase/response regulator
MSETRKILVVDDEIGICEGIQRALSREGFQVDSAYEGDSGLKKVRTEEYDLVLIDVMLPGINGIELISLIHAVDPEIICIIITGYATVELAVQAIKGGAHDFLTKPFSVDELLHTVNQGFEHRQLSLQARRTQEAEAEARRLAELDRAKRDFIKLVTHELQAPVSAIETYIKLILQGYIPPEDQPDILEKCLVRSGEEQALIADLLELGHLEVIETFKESEVHLDESLRSVLESCREQMEEKKISLQLEIDGKIPPILAPPEQIKSLWSNLVSNAIKYTLENGHITIKLFCGPENITGEISDTGIGIPEGDQARLFSEFFRAKNAKALEYPGTGLGLAIVKRILDGLRGKIEVESEMGRGSTFKFTIPIP